MTEPAPTARTTRWQFSLRALLIVTTAAAVSLLIATKVGVVEAAFVSLGAVFATLGEAALRRRKFLAVGLCTLLAALGIFFGSFDVIWHEAYCPRCGLVWDVDEYRVFHLRVCTERGTEDSQRLTSRIAADLGCPCEHGNKQRPLMRFWGGVIPHRFKWKPVMAWIDDDWYGPEQSAAMQAIGQQHPEVAREFHARVLEQRDRKFELDFVKDFRQEHDPTYDVP